jgi:alpha-1,2-mannosyltransferase
MLSAPRTKVARHGRSGARPLETATIAYLAIAIVCFVIASGLVFLELRTKNGLHGLTQFDDDVYFGTILHFVNGALPYRDYVMVQPPGIAVVLAPIGILGRIFGARDGLAIARIFTGTVAGMNAALVVVLLRRYGLLAALFGGLLFAVYPPAYNADHTLMLEPYLVIFCLIAIALAFPVRTEAGTWRLVAAGVSLGVAGSVKLWAVFPLVALLVVLGLSDIRKALRVLFGAVLGAVAVCGVFFAAAPSAFVRDIITSQLARTTAHPTPVYTRLWSIVGLNLSSKSLLLGSSHTSILIVTCIVAAMLLLGCIVPSLFRRGSAFESFILLATALVVASLFVPQVFYAHYAYFSAPFLAIGLGIAFSRIVSLVGNGASHLSRRVGPALQIGLAALLVVALGVGSAITVLSEHRYEVYTMRIFGDPGARVTAVIPEGACAVSDAEGLLIAGNRAVSSRSDCPVVVDSTGTWISFVPAHPPAAHGVEVSDPALVAYWANVFRHVDYIVLSSGKTFRIPWTPALLAEVKDHFHELPGVEPLIYEADNLSS